MKPHIFLEGGFWRVTPAPLPKGEAEKQAIAMHFKACSFAMKKNISRLIVRRREYRNRHESQA